MNDIKIRPVIFGAVALLVVFLLMSVLSSLLVLIVGTTWPPSLLMFLWLVGISGPMVAGYVAARMSPVRPILHGLLAAACGGTVVTILPFLFLHTSDTSGFGATSIGYSVAGVILLFGALSLVGSVFVIFKRV